MKIRVNPHNVKIIREQTEPINEKEIKISKCEFEFDEEITNGFVKEAYFTLNGKTYKQIIENNECDYPSEVLVQKGTLEIGVVAFLVENEEEIKRYNPSPDYFESWIGSLKDADNSSQPTPTEFEQLEQIVTNNTNDILDLQENKADKTEIPDTSNFVTKNVNDLTYYTLATSTGSTIELSINSSTYVMTLNLKNSAGTTISTGTVDLPLESVVVNGSYDDTTKKIILTLQSGNTIEFSVADLVSGLQSEITSSNKLASDLVDDSNSGNKFVTTSEKQTWNSKGTYSKPSGGIPSTDLSSAVQTSLGKADTALQSETYTGTITSVKMNGTTISSSGEADLGTVLTSHQNIKTINSTSLVGTGDVTVQPTLVSGTNIKTINNTSILGSGNISIATGVDISDVEIDGNSVVSNGVASFVTFNGDYDWEENPLATANDIDSFAADINNKVTAVVAEQGSNRESTIYNQGGFIRLMVEDNDTNDVGSIFLDFDGSVVISGTGGVSISDVNTPTSDDDAVNKLYVDTIVGNIESLLSEI